MPSSEAPLAAVAMASPVTSGPLHLENPRVVGISPASPATLKTPQASSAAAWWSRVVTVQIGPRHAVAPVTMVASQMAQKSSTGIKPRAPTEADVAPEPVPGSTADCSRRSPTASGICTRWRQPEGLLFCKSKLSVPTYREEAGVHPAAQAPGQTQMVAHAACRIVNTVTYLAFPN